MALFTLAQRIARIDCDRLVTMRYFDCVAVSFYAVYPAQHKSAARVRAFVEFVAEAFRPAKP